MAPERPGDGRQVVDCLRILRKTHPTRLNSVSFVIDVHLYAPDQWHRPFVDMVVRFGCQHSTVLFGSYKES